MTVDLLLGSALGEWALEHIMSVSPDDVGAVISRDASIRERAETFGLCTGAELPPDPVGAVALSLHYPVILSAEEISRYDRVYNLHPGFLPFGRGYFPVFWALYEGTPAGCTLHEIDEFVDKGRIVAQTEVPYTDADTGGSVHARVIEAERALLTAWWPRLSDVDRPPSAARATGKGTYHSLRDFMAMRDEPDLSAMTADDLARLVRAGTHAPNPGIHVGSGVRLTAG